MAIAARPKLSLWSLCLAVLALTVFGTTLFDSRQAHAEFRMCNKTGATIGVAVGYQNDKKWTTEGWWNLPANKCEVLVDGPLVSRYYYVYALDYQKGGEWSGEAFMCTRERSFTITGTEDCVARGHERTGFYEVDTGNQQSWTVQLKEPDESGVGGR